MNRLYGKTETLLLLKKMNKLEQGVKNEQVGPKGEPGPAGVKGDRGLQGPAGPAYTLTAATKSALGGVKQAALVAEAAGANVTKEEFKKLLDALKTAGIMASA